MVSIQRRSRSPRSEVASRSLTARIPVNGVRTSCAKAASAASTMSEDGRGDARRAFAGFADVFKTRGFAGRLLGVRALRDERDVSAMIPLPQPRASMPRSGGRSHAGRLFGPESACGKPKAAILVLRRNQGSPISFRMPSGVTPRARNSRNPVAPDDLESFAPAASRIRS